MENHERKIQDLGKAAHKILPRERELVHTYIFPIGKVCPIGPGVNIPKNYNQIIILDLENMDIGSIKSSKTNVSNNVSTPETQAQKTQVVEGLE